MQDQRPIRSCFEPKQPFECLFGVPVAHAGFAVVVECVEKMCAAIRTALNLALRSFTRNRPEPTGRRRKRVRRLQRVDGQSIGQQGA